MSKTAQQYLTEQQKIEISAFMDMDTVSQLLKVLGQRKKYANHYLEFPGADRQTALDSIEKCNELLIKILAI